MVWVFKMTNYIWVTTQREFMHKYNDAPKEVKFLSYPHRHIFHFKVYIEVRTNDRDIEFIIFKRFIEKLLNNFKFDLNGSSCEMISDYLIVFIKGKYPHRKVKIEISEDKENGILMNYE